MKFTLSNTQEKTLVWLGILITILASLVFFSKRLEEKTNLYLDGLLHSYEETWSAVELLNSDNVREYAFTIDSIPEISTVMHQLKFASESQKQIYRSELQQHLASFYERMENNGIHQFHFVDAEGDSFLRMHAPDVYGDNIYDVRNSFRLANKYKESVTGFEHGKIVSGYRSIFPLFYKDQHVGAYEISVQLDKFESDFKKLSKTTEAHIILPPQTIEAVLPEYKDNYSSEDYLTDWLLEDPYRKYFLSKQSISPEFKGVLSSLTKTHNLESFLSGGLPYIQTLESKNHHYVVAFVPIMGLSNDLYGYVAIKSETNYIAGLQNAFWLQILLSTVFLLLLGAALARLITNSESLDLASKVFDVKTAMLITDQKGVIVKVNKQFSDVTGYYPNEVIGKTPAVLSSGRQDKTFYEQMWNTILAQGEWHGEIWNRKKDGSEYCELLTIQQVKDHVGKNRYFIGSFYDITSQKVTEDRVKFLSTYDPLTKLINQGVLNSHLERCFDLANQSSLYYGLVYINVNNFKLINDLHGYEFGNDLIVKFADYLQLNANENHIVSRIRGDHFAILTTQLLNKEEANQLNKSLCHKLKSGIERALILAKIDTHVSLSIGSGIFGNNEYENTQDVFLLSESLMRMSKEHGSGEICFLTEEISEELKQNLAVQKDFSEGLMNREFELFFQTQHDNNGQVIGMEGLIRWNHPVKGLLYPDLFIPIAEQQGFIHELGLWIFEEACYTLDKLSNLDRFNDITLSINVSAKQLYHEDFFDSVSSILKKYQVQKNKLKLEVTESMVISNIDNVREIINKFINLGLVVSLDDFGTGYSSLMSLKDLPFSQIKIDKSFVFEILSEQKSKALTEGTIHLAKKLNLDLVAEGVETKAHFDMLQLLGCEVYQGYYFSRPITYNQFLEKFSN